MKINKLLPILAFYLALGGCKYYEKYDAIEAIILNKASRRDLGWYNIGLSRNGE
jgi:hypothetical protein